MRCGSEQSTCKLVGEVCTVNNECCNGFCGDDGTGTLVCGGSGACVPEGGTRSTSSDCCGSLDECIDLGGGPFCFGGG